MQKATSNKALTKPKQQQKKKQQKKATKSLLTVTKRTKISIGHGQRVSRAESMAANKITRTQLETDEKNARKAKKEAELAVVELPAVTLEKQKRALISLLDLPRDQTEKHNDILQQLVESNLPWTPVEVGQILALAGTGTSTNYKAGSSLVQNLIDRDFLPYKASFRGLTRLYENAYHYKGAKASAAQFKNLYPVTEFDEVGMPISKVVFTEPVPNFNEVAQLPTSPESIDDIKAFQQTLAESGQQFPTRWQTEHHLLRQLLKNGKKDDASKQLFHIFKRLGIAKDDKVPGKFDPIPFGTIFNKPGAANNFKPDFPLYYKAIDTLTAEKNWSAAMTAMIYIRTFNRPIDVTPLRERTQNKQWRDFLDIHTHDGQTARLVVKHFLKELIARRGYRKDMEANVKGSEDAVTFSAPTRENALSYSPIINTESENLVLLTDRNYDAEDVVRAKGGFKYTTANHVIEYLGEYGIKAQLSYGSKLSSAKHFFNHYDANPDATTPPNAPKHDTPIAFDLTVIIPKEELYAYADRKLVSLGGDIKKELDEMPIVSDTVRGIVKQRYLKERAEARKVIAAQKKEEEDIKTAAWIARRDPKNQGLGAEDSEETEA